MKKLIYVCSPLRGDSTGEDIRPTALANMLKAEQHCKDVLIAGHIPIAPHVMLSGILHDDIPNERQTALEVGLELVCRCDELWVFGGGYISEGMSAELTLARELELPIKYVKAVK